VRQPLFSKAVVIVEVCLVPLVLFASVFRGSISHLIADFGFDPSQLANIGFLQDQSELFVARGIDLHSVARADPWADSPLARSHSGRRCMVAPPLLNLLFC
jgi:hypothetical protein